VIPVNLDSRQRRRLGTRSRVFNSALKQKFVAAWSRTDTLFRIIRDEELLTRPIVWRHPFIFYVGHLPAFAWNQICGGILNWKSQKPYFDDLFCRGMDPDVDTGECHWHPEAPPEWPSSAQVLSYRDRVRRALLESIEAVPRVESGDVMAQRGRVFQMVLEHEFMHHETLLYMIQQLPPEKKNRPEEFGNYVFRTGVPSRGVDIPAGETNLGAEFNRLSFGWDNEFSRMTVEVPGFTIDSVPVTNGEFLEFVRCGAYNDASLWRAEDWSWKKLESQEHPKLWSKRNGSWWYRTIFEELPLSQVSGWPVYVSLAEARAFARWRNKSLPNETQFHRAAFSGPDGRERPYPWGDAKPAERYGNFDFNSWSPMPVGSTPAGASRWGVEELVGNGWEWTDTPFAPFPGFSAYMTKYPDYSRDFFDGKHYVLKGASWATGSDLIRPSFRNWYQAHYPYVFAKFRCVSHGGA
jgi:ergothioneine biosynthesis protein EgtB